MKHMRKRLSAVAMSQRVRSCGRGSLGLVACLAVLGAAASLLFGDPRPAVAAGSTTSTGPSCPASNPPDELTLTGGTPQTAKLDSQFAAPFQVVLANSNGCPVTTAVAGTTVIFSAPTSGSTTASGVFASSGSSSVTVGTDANGSAQAPSFTANDIAGSYTVTASSNYGSVTFTLTNTPAGVAASIAAQTPLSQAAFTDASYNKPLQVVVLDANGNPVAGANVTFTLGSTGGGGGSGAAADAGASFAGGQSQASEQTNASGVATSPLLTANGTPGKFTATAATAGVTEPASFQLDNVAGRPPRLTLTRDAHCTAVVDTRYGKPLQVEVVGAAGKPLQGVQVTFTLGSSGGSGGAGGGAGSATAGASFLGGSSQAIETTGARGRATSPLFTANATAGRFTATIAATGITNPVSLTLDNLAGRPPLIEPLDTREAVTIGSRYSRPLEVRVLDAAGKPVQGATVTFSLGSAAGGGGAGVSGGPGASFLGGTAQATETTTATGLATSPRFTANTTPGTFTATAASAGVTNPAMFTLDNLAAKLATVVASDPLRSATVGARFPAPLEVRVVAGDGKPVQGATVTFTLGSSGGGGGSNAATSAAASFLGGSAQATETTNAAGRAVSPALTANTSAGAFTATASLGGTAEVTTFALRNLAGKPTTISAGAAATEQATEGTRFPIRLAVTVTDKHGNPVAGVLVKFSAPGHGPSGRFPHGLHSVRVRTNAAGIAVAPAFTANTTTGGYVVKAAAEASSAAAAFALVNQPPGQAA